MKVWGKTILFGALMLWVAACERDLKKPNYEFLPEMVESIPYDSFAPNPITKDRKTLQVPVRGTIPRGHLPYPFSSSPEDAQRASLELKNPTPPSPGSLARGKALYENNCLICHGVTGKGDGPLIPKYPNPPSFTSKNSRNLSEGSLFHTITVGSGEMGAYGSQIEPKDRWKLVSYVQTLQGPKSPKTQKEKAPQEPKSVDKEVSTKKDAPNEN